jgi:hypothetical protein
MESQYSLRLRVARDIIKQSAIDSNRRKQSNWRLQNARYRRKQEVVGGKRREQRAVCDLWSAPVAADLLLLLLIRCCCCSATGDDDLLLLLLNLKGRRSAVFCC